VTLPPRAFVQDLWSPLSHIPAVGNGTTRTPGIATWVDDTDARRLTAYRVLTAYRSNNRREWLPAAMWAKELNPSDLAGQWAEGEKAPAELWREYGHARLLVETARSLVLGDDQTIVVPDADPDDDTGPDPFAVQVQDWLTAWADTERLKDKLLVQETNSVGDGDGVLVVSWSRHLARPILRGYDPGFYFPDLTAADQPAYTEWDAEYPPVVHLAWEYDQPDGTRMLRRHTWRMEKLPAPVRAPWGGTREWTCRYTVAEWRLDQIRAQPRGGQPTVYTLTEGQFRGQTLTDDDLEVDFIPVVHIPNTSTGEDHFGESIPTLVSQILDDLAMSDTDLAGTAESSAVPARRFTGAGHARPLPGGPGTDLFLPDGASSSYEDTSTVLDAGIKQNQRLLENLAVNSRLALSLLGRVSPADAVSGFAMDLGFAPARAALRNMRLVRGQKHPLLLKFAVRTAQARAALPAGPTPAAVIDLGSGLPSDRGLAVDQVKALLPLRAISTGTAVRMLQAAGLPIDDADAELEAIRRESYAAAVQLVDATGDIAAARHLLGLADDPTPVPPPAPPTGTDPPAGGQPAVPPAE
jgi:hypothetical protein